MFSVLFEVHPKKEEWDAYLGFAKMLRPELERVKGFVDNIRYKSLSREGWILSLSNWDDEKALVRWRTQAKHHEVQEKGREEVLLDYHLRVAAVLPRRQTPLIEGSRVRFPVVRQFFSTRVAVRCGAAPTYSPEGTQHGQSSIDPIRRARGCCGLGRRLRFVLSTG